MDSHMEVVKPTDKGSQGVANANASPIMYELFQLLQVAQLQNGLRQQDYARYHHYCTRRLRRLAVLLKWTYPKKQYKARTITPDMITGTNHLSFLIVSIERAWSYAMQLKSELHSDVPRKRFHVIKRMKRAAKWAILLEQCCEDPQRMSTLTAIQLIAYVNDILGQAWFECEQLNTSLNYFVRAKYVYEQLIQLADTDLRTICEERYKRILDSVRYCQHLIKQSAMSNPDYDERNHRPDVDSNNPNAIINNAANKEWKVLVDAKLKILQDEHQEKEKLKVQPKPAKPILFDLAFNAMTFPDLSAKISASMPSKPVPSTQPVISKKPSSSEAVTKMDTTSDEAEPTPTSASPTSQQKSGWGFGLGRLWGR